ncbi:hypothetical protein M422DRAFT_46409 [Sphaerobolus stellatus SS14]|uniref:Uncharacterized protein n=1 Tax=Sphaerobolus stellatus (strain SS14) TaxID=990650 RepID=A0A0C9W3J3_SPHS4|nr:hypothetical protein M422DRAFT_46409 [Sphaerobolus stellatus SS14]
MAPQTHRQAQTTPATPLQSDTPSTLNAVFSITAEWVDGTVIGGHTRPEPPPSTNDHQPTTTRQRTIAGKGKAPKPPTKAAETRARKQREKKRKQRLAHNKHEAIANDLAFDDEPPHQAEVNQPLRNNPIPSQPLLQNPTATPQHPDRRVSFAVDQHGNTSPHFFTPTHIPNPQSTMRNRSPSCQSATGSSISYRRTPQSTRSRCLFAPPKGVTKCKATDVWFFFRKPTKQNGTINICMLCNRRGTGEGIYSKTTSTGVLRTHL